MKKLGLLLIVGMTMTGCMYGLREVETVKLRDGRTLDYYQFTTHGEGVEVVTVDSFICDAENTKCEPKDHTVASGNSALVSLFNGAGTAIVDNVSAAYPVSKLRPDTTNVSQSGSGAHVNTTSASEATGGTGGVGQGGQGGVGHGGAGGSGGSASYTGETGSLSRAGGAGRDGTVPEGGSPVNVTIQNNNTNRNSNRNKNRTKVAAQAKSGSTANAMATGGEGGAGGQGGQGGSGGHGGSSDNGKPEHHDN